MNELVIRYSQAEGGTWVNCSQLLLQVDTEYKVSQEWIKGALCVERVAAILTSSGRIFDFVLNRWRDDTFSGGMKFDSAKPRMDLISPLALTYLAQVLTFGATKYAAHNWRKGIPMSKLVAASMRHITAIAAGEDIDNETGLPHAAHLMCEAMFICEQQVSQNKEAMDDRYNYTQQQKDLLAALLASVSSEDTGNTKGNSIQLTLF